MSAHASPQLSTLDLIDSTTIASLAFCLCLLLAAYSLSRILLAPNTPASLRTLFIWHGFDALIHFFFEGSFLYNCFFTSVSVGSAVIADGRPASQVLPQDGQGYPHPASMGAAHNNFLGRADRVSGAYYAENWAGSLWRIYASADRRWGGADETVVSLELLTVLLGGPLAVFICVGIWRRWSMTGFWMTVLAVGELYGGFMTFAPEWLTGNRNLDGSNFMYMWAYLVFFNMLWVFLPLYALYISYQDMAHAMEVRTAYYRKMAELSAREEKKASKVAE